jgi:isovaleryl-CoA dehydrogenase
MVTPPPTPLVPAESAEILERAAEVAQAHLAPNAERCDAAGEFPVENFRALGRAGLMGMFVPRRLGGLEADHFTFALVAEKLAQSCASTAMMWVMHHSQYVVLSHWGTDEQKAFFLPPVARGESLFASGLTEPQTGGTFYCVSSLEHVGDSVVLNTIKDVVSGANYADWVFVICRASSDASGRVKSGVFAPGLKSPDVRPYGAWTCLGMRGTGSSGLEYKNCRVPQWHALDPETTRLASHNSLTPVGLIGFSAVWLGIAQAALDFTVRHATGRTHELIIPERRGASDASEPSGAEAPQVATIHRTVAQYETVQRQVAEMRARVDAARAIVHELARLIDRLQPDRCSPVPEEHMGAARPLMASARIIAGEAAIDVCRVGMRVSGLRGMSRGSPLDRNMRDALTAQVMAPGEDLMKISLGRQVLGVE